MAILAFPPVEEADEDGFLAWGGDLEPESPRLAYRSGIFPWPMPGYPVPWFAPPERALLHFADFHVARSLKKLLRQRPWEVRIDHDFAGVIRGCAGAARPGQRGTWITRDVIKAYSRLFELGEAHCLGVYLENELVGGLYGVSWGGYFAGESMFHRETGASKVALVHLVEFLGAQGVTWIDSEVLNPLFASFGAREVPRDEFMAMLQTALAAPPIRWKNL